MSCNAAEKATLIAMYSLIIISILVTSSPASAVQREIHWTHDGANTSYFNIYSNTRNEEASTLIGVVDRTERKYMVDQPDDCSPVFVVVMACNEDVCSQPSAVRAFRIECVEPRQPIISDGIGGN